MATYRLYPMAVAACDSPAPRVFYLGDVTETVPTVFLFWLLKSETRAVLVDTGFTADAMVRYMPNVQQKPEQDPIRQLQGCGVQPEEIEMVVCTHAHWDHLSGVVQRYRNARVVLQRTEYEFVTRPPHPWFGQLVDQETVRVLGQAGAPRLVLIDGEGEIAPGISVIQTPGHTLGHQSVLVDTAQGKACIAADACFFYRNLDQDIGPGFNCSLIDALASLAKLRRLKEEGVIILPGHEPQLFERFPAQPIL